jgi:hypothetical protein
MRRKTSDNPTIQLIQRDYRKILHRQTVASSSWFSFHTYSSHVGRPANRNAVIPSAVPKLSSIVLPPRASAAACARVVVPFTFEPAPSLWYLVSGELDRSVIASSCQIASEEPPPTSAAATVGVTSVSASSSSTQEVARHTAA